MPRNPAMQADNRLRELTPLLKYYANELRGKTYEVINAEEKLEKARAERAKVAKGFEKINSLIARLAKNDGLFPWGLPTTICIAEYKRMVPDADIPESDYAQEAKCKEVDFHSGHTPGCSIRIEHESTSCNCGEF